MITVKCGYEGCDWKFEIPDDIVYADYIVKIDEKNHTYPLVYLDHAIKEHNVPPAIWERLE